MSTYRYLHFDVFTDRVFEGNQLAVFVDASGMPDSTMQSVAREMNFSESTFVFPAERAGTDVRMRIFTPGQELPMAGHPTIGSTFALAAEGAIPSGRPHVVFELGVGPTRVELDWHGSELSFAWMDQQLPQFRPPVSPLDDILRAAGVDAAAVARTGLPVEEVSCGVPYLLVPVDTRAAVDAADPEAARFRRVRSAFGSAHLGVFLFSLEPVEPAVTAYSRMFAPGLGVAEDPATGSACGPLGSYLVKHRVLSPSQSKEIVNLQGVAMGRPSRIHIGISAGDSETITRVQVGGRAVKVGEGSLIA